MARLRTMAPRLSAAPSRLAPAPVTAGTGFKRTDGRTRHERGYDNEWVRLRASVLDAEPLCRRCAKQGRVTAATQVHHIQRFIGLDDPLRLDPRNCEPICRPCHDAESARQSSVS